MSFRKVISIGTTILLLVIIYLSRHEIAEAWSLLGQVNLLILSLLIPVQIFSFYSAAEIGFSYLRAKQSIGEIRRRTLTRLALEMNFVNHILPSAGVSGISYMSWRLSGFGLSAGKATMSQVVRFVMGFIAFAALLIPSVIIITIDGSINRWIILGSSAFVFAMIGLTAGSIFILSSPRRMHKFAAFITHVSNSFMKKFFPRSTSRLKLKKVEEFFDDMHDDFLVLKRDRQILVKPFWWAIAFTISDVMLFWVTFLALGEMVNPAAILVAYGLAVVVAVIALTPGGAGVLETIMVTVLALSGVAPSVAVAGVLLTRVITLLGTVAFGYFFYQNALKKYGNGKPPITSK